jgi:hypothetical protein
MLDGEMGVNNYQCMQILGPERYHRLSPILSEPIGLDDAKAIPDLIQFAEEVDIEPTVEWINQNFLDQDPNLDSSLETEQEAPDSIGIKIHRSESVRPLRS